MNVTVNSTANGTTVCKYMKATGDGSWVGDLPINFALPLLIIQLSLVLFFSRIFAVLLRPLRQPRVIAEVLVCLHPSRAPPPTSRTLTVPLVAAATFPSRSVVCHLPHPCHLASVALVPTNLSLASCLPPVSSRASFDPCHPQLLMPRARLLVACCLLAGWHCAGRVSDG